MTTKFGILSKLNFLQDWASSLIASCNPAIIHNLEKYHALKKVHYLSAIEGVQGDYLEFGVFTGSSFCHSIRCCRYSSRFNSELHSTKFYGFDSFAGFGNLSESDKHPFFTDENFATSLHAVNERAKAAAKGLQYQLVPGFFSDSLKSGPSSLGIKKSRIIFIDSDTYSSASEALAFCGPTLQEGTFIILDDYFSYKGSSVRGVAGAFNEFVKNASIEVRTVMNYGMGGAVFIVASLSSVA